MRQPAIDDADIRLYEFDFDLTLMIFFVSPDEEIYGRYGGRTGEDPDSRQSLKGLHYAMQSALAAHASKDKPLVPQRHEEPRTVRSLRGGRGGGCLHCHQVNERLNSELKRNDQWTRHHIFRYPPPDNVGLVLDVDGGDVVDRIEPDSPAAKSGLEKGDVIESIGRFPVNSFADAQYALDGAPPTGEIAIAWRRDNQLMDAKLTLPEGWRKHDISWRRSMEWIVPSARVFGRNLKPEERREHGLTETQLAFWQSYPVSKVAAAAGVQEGDIILGFDGKQLNMSAYEFLDYVRGHYLCGDTVKVDILRDGKRLQLPMTLP